MANYISIIRGINVSGQKLIKMEDLRKMYESLGFCNVTSYVQSGNVVFEGNKQEVNELEQRITLQIEKDFGFTVLVIVLTVERLKQIIGNNPFLSDINKNPAFFHLTFLAAAPAAYNSQSITDKTQGGEAVFISNNAVYLYCPEGYGKTKLTNNFLENKLGVGATTRNWKTANALLAIAQGNT